MINPDEMVRVEMESFQAPAAFGGEEMWELVLLSRRHDVRMTGMFDNDWETGDLVFIVSDYHDASGGTRMRLEADAGDGREPLCSDVFEPGVGRIVRFDGVCEPGEVRRVWAEVMR